MSIESLTALGFSRLNTASWLTAHRLFTGHANGEVRPCVDGCKWGVGWWECWGLGDGGCPLNLLIALWQSTSGEISHALLASCTENPLSGSPEMGIPYGHTGNTTQMKGIIWALRRELSAPECSSWQVWRDDSVGIYCQHISMKRLQVWNTFHTSAVFAKEPKWLLWRGFERNVTP